MALIKIELSAPPVDGMDVKFKAPCDCTAVTGLLLTYPEGSNEFTFRDCHNNNLSNLGNLFTEGAYVKVIVDVQRGHAYLQNADTNSYLDALSINNNALRKNNYIADVLNVDLNNPDGTANRSGYFDTSAVNLPSSDVTVGVRDVYFVDNGFVVVEARCNMKDSSNRIWRNTFNKNAGGWLGWESLDKRDFLSVNGGNMKDGAYINFMAPNEGITWQYGGENYVLRPLAGTGLELLANNGNGYYAALKVKPDGKLCLGTTEITDLMIADGESKGHVHIHNDGEGGTIKISGPNSTYHYEFDAFNDKSLRLHTASKNPNGNAKFWSFWGDSGTFTTDRLETGEAIAVQYGGTGAKDVAGAKANLGIPTKTLLWHNAAPLENTFAAQTLSLDLSNYNFIEIVFTVDPNAAWEQNIAKFAKNSYGHMQVMGHTRLTGGQLFSAQRAVHVDNTGIQFEGAIYKFVGEVNSIENSTYLVPVSIYGIKEAT